MATTTEEAIRDRVRTVIEAIIPSSLAGDRFRRYRYELGDDFRGYANANPQSNVRRFHVRAVGNQPAEPPIEVSNTDIEQHYITMEVVVAYPQSNRWGGDDALDRDDAMVQDRHAIEGGICLRGAANFASANGFPDATYRGSVTTYERNPNAACDFLVVVVTMSFVRVMP